MGIILCSWMLHLLTVSVANQTETLAGSDSKFSVTPIITLPTIPSVLTIEKTTASKSSGSEEHMEIQWDPPSPDNRGLVSSPITGTTSNIPPFFQLVTFTIDWDQPQDKILIETTLLACGEKEHLCLSHVGQSPRSCDLRCSPCRCDPSCYRYGDCCADILGESNAVLDNDLTSSEFTSCVEPLWTIYENVTSAVMVTKCPSNHTVRDDVVTKCEQPDTMVENQATPVTDLTSLITFQNKYCAECHNYDNYTGWTHTATCLDAGPLYGFTTKADLWQAIFYAACKLVTHPPKDVPVHRCPLTTIDSCNVTGDWQETDNSQLTEYCDLYYHPVKDRETLYKNVFCALCNGAVIQYIIGDVCLDGPAVPFPLSVILSFGTSKQIFEESSEKSYCNSEEIFDPFTEECMAVKCQSRQVFNNGKCDFAFESTRGLGFRLTILLTSPIGNLRMQYEPFAFQYSISLLDISGPEDVLIIDRLEIIPLLTPRQENASSLEILAKISVVSASDTPLNTLDDYFTSLASYNFTFKDDDDKIHIFSSSYHGCPEPSTLMYNMSVSVVTLAEEWAKETIWGCRDITYSCLSYVRYAPIITQPDCPFLEYNLSLSNFSYDFLSNNITFFNSIFPVDPSRIYLCGEVLRLCSDVLDQISSVLSQSERRLIVSNSQEQDPILTIVSLVCLSFSLLGLLLTFIVYSILPQLRTLPGKMTMFLVLHLFGAQLFFVVGSNRTDDPTLCKAMGILIHYFWLTSFVWMMSSAYHMYKLFSNLLPSNGVTHDEANKIIACYCVLCHAVSTVVVACSITYHVINSRGSDIGYGGKVCFIRGNVGIGVFFAGPLSIMLVFNLFFFAQTVKTIRSVPDMAIFSNKGNQTFIFAYLKLAVLLGFSWLFGLIGSAFKLVVLNYMFVCLTGSQGLLIFISFCLMGRSRKLLKDRLCGNGESLDSVTPNTNLSGREINTII